MIMKIIIFILLFLFLGCGETRDSFYQNLDAAEKDGAIEKGWLPNILPESSKEIYERHSLDTNGVWLRFKFDRKDIKKLIDKTKELTPTEIKKIKIISPGHASWWPQKFDIDSFNIKANQSGTKIYKYDEILEFSDGHKKMIQSFFIIEWDSNIAYYWKNES